MERRSRVGVFCVYPCSASSAAPRTQWCPNKWRSPVRPRGKRLRSSRPVAREGAPKAARIVIVARWLSVRRGVLSTHTSSGYWSRLARPSRSSIVSLMVSEAITMRYTWYDKWVCICSQSFGILRRFMCRMTVRTRGGAPAARMVGSWSISPCHLRTYHLIFPFDAFIQC
jgi:hypothetical protein